MAPWPLMTSALSRLRPELGDVLLMSDLGPALWTQQDLRDWLSLDASGALSDRDEAFRQIDRIRVEPTYCPRGIAPYLCRALRDSLNARRLTQRRLGGASPPDFFQGLARIHNENQLLRFPWGTDIRYPGQIAPHNAQDLFQILARESLLRRIMFIDLDHNVGVVGCDIDLESRLLVAAHPSLMPLLPFLARFPLEMDDEYTIGGTIESLPLGHREYEFMGRELVLVASLSTLSDHQPSAASATFLISEEFLDEAEEDDIDRLKDIAERWVNSRLRDFRSKTGVAATSAKVAWDTHKFLNIEVRAPTESLRTLFIYFLVHEPSPPEFHEAQGVP
ncbi:MAG: hypothetical protein AB7G93_17275 [Bdellovibrionales bacterium]